MKRVLLVIMAIAVVAVATAADISNFVEVSGKGEVEVTPNEFTLAITIDEQVTKGRYTVEEVESKMIKALSKIGIEQEALTMSGISSLAVKRKNALTTASYELKVNSVETLTKCYDSFETLGITSVRLSKATNSEIERYRSEARAIAVKDAKTRAHEIGEALGQDIGGCFEITDRSSYTNEAVLMSFSATRASNAADSSAEPVEFRDITITYNVNAKFILELDAESRRMIVQ